MKRYLSIVLAAFLLLSVCACKSEETDAYENIGGEVMSEHSDGHNSDKLQLETNSDNTGTEQGQNAGAADQNTVDANAPSDAQVQENASDGISEDGDTGDEATGEENITEEPVQPVEQEPKITNPLTGVEANTDLSSFRPFAVMIDNGPEALPQDGISYADILYEVTAYAGGATRCMGIFTDLSVIDIIGGVRSCRSQFVDLALAYDAIYVHAGSSDEGAARIRNTGCDDIDSMHSGWLYRDDWRLNNIGYTHSIVLDTKAVLENIESAGYRIKHNEEYSYGLRFTENAEFAEAQDAIKITVCIGGNKNTDFEYNADTGLYMAYEYGEAWIDRANDQQLAFTNLLLIHMDSRVSEGVYQIHTALGTGTGYYLCNGKLVEITWSRETLDDPYRYFYTDGTPVTLQRGKTYICVYTAKGYVEWE